MNGEYNNNRNYNGNHRGGFQNYNNHHDYEYFENNQQQEPISKGGFDIKPDMIPHSPRTCTSTGSFGIVKGTGDYKCYECTKPTSPQDKVPFSFKNIQGLDSIQPFMPKNLEKRSGFTMFQNSNNMQNCNSALEEDTTQSDTRSVSSSCKGDKEILNDSQNMGNELNTSYNSQSCSYDNRNEYSVDVTQESLISAYDIRKDNAMHHIEVKKDIEKISIDEINSDMISHSDIRKEIVTIKQDNEDKSKISTSELRKNLITHDDRSCNIPFQDKNDLNLYNSGMKCSKELKNESFLPHYDIKRDPLVEKYDQRIEAIIEPARMPLNHKIETNKIPFDSKIEPARMPFNYRGESTKMPSSISTESAKIPLHVKNDISDTLYRINRDIPKFSHVPETFKPQLPIRNELQKNQFNDSVKKIDTKTEVTNNDIIKHELRKNIPVPLVENRDEVIFSKNDVSKNVEENIGETDKDDFVRVHLTGEKYENYKSWLQTRCDKSIIRNVIETGYEIPESIDSYIIPTIIKGRDLIVQVDDVQSKYVSYFLPIIDNILKNKYINGQHEPIALILNSSKESVLKCSEIVEKLINETTLKYAKCYGQYSFKQNLDELKNGCNILCSTPGRLIHFLKSGDISLGKVKYFIIDEVDKMMECGFDEIISNIVNDYNLPEKYQRINIVGAKGFSNNCNDLLEMIINNSYTMITKNCQNSTSEYTIKRIVNSIEISVLSEMLKKEMYELKEKNGNEGISLFIDIPDNTKQKIIF
uniref:Helicase ATP-binding domain-containing protein n=1 Tax=Parastrongyloides trichosuri TaxID=131310 RepID=A0A0N4ZH80_PARTI